MHDLLVVYISHTIGIGLASHAHVYVRVTSCLWFDVYARHQHRGKWNSQVAEGSQCIQSDWSRSDPKPHPERLLR